MSDLFGNIPIQPTAAPPAAPKVDPPPQHKPAKPPRPRRRSPVATDPEQPSTHRSVGKPPERAGRSWLVGLILVICLVIYGGLGFIGVPYYLKKIVPSNFTAKTGLLLETGEVDFNPFTFVLALRGTEISDRDGSHLLSLRNLEVDLAAFSLLRNSLVCKSLTIDGLVADIIRASDGSYNFTRLFGRQTSALPSQIIDFSDLPFYFSLNNIVLQNSTVHFLDSPVGKRHLFANILLKLPTFSNFPFQANQYLQPYFSATINGSPVELTGQAPLGDDGQVNQATRLTIDLSDVDLASYVGYLPFTPPIEVEQGKARGKIALSFDPAGAKGDKLSFTFDLHLTDLEVVGKNQRLRFTAPVIQLDGSLRPVSRVIHLVQLTLRDPILHTYGPSLLANINSLRREAKADSAGTKTPFSLAMDQVVVDNGQVRMVNAEKLPTAEWQRLQLSVKGYSSQPENSQDYGSFHCSAEKTGAATYFSWQGNFTGAQSLSGPLNLAKANSADLLQAAGAGEHFNTSGITDITGQLYLQPEGDGDLAFALQAAEVAVQDFVLLAESETLLSAPLVRMAPLSWDQSGIDFGTLQMKGTTARLNYQLPEPLRRLTSARYRLQGLDFEGRASIATATGGTRELELNTLIIKAQMSGGSTKDNLSIVAGIEGGGQVKAQGEVSLAPFSLTLRSTFSDLPAGDTLQWLSGSGQFTAMAGKMSGSGTLKLPENSFTGELQLMEASRSGLETGITAWDQATLQDVSYTREPFRLGISRLEIVGAEGVYRLEASEQDAFGQLATFFQNRLPIKLQLRDAKKKNATSPLTIELIELSNARIEVVDNRLEPPWRGELREFSGQIGAISNTDSTAAGVNPFSFSGLLDDAPLTVEGEIKLFDPAASGSYRLTLEGYPLASFHQQLVDQLDVATGSGEVRIQMTSRRQDDMLSSSGSATFVGIEPLADTAASALPLALLTRADGTITLPFERSQPSATGITPVFTEILKAFQNMVLKATVSPLLLTTGDFTDMIGNEWVEFRPGEFLLSEKGQHTTTRYSALLIAHPQVAIELSGGVNLKIDGEAITNQLRELEKQRVERENQRLFQLWQEQQAARVEKIRQQQLAAGNVSIVETDLPSDLLETFVPLQPEPVVVHDEMFIDLAHKRQGILYQYFTEQLGVAANRVSTVPLTSLAEISPEPQTGLHITLRAIRK